MATGILAWFFINIVANTAAGIVTWGAAYVGFGGSMLGYTNVVIRTSVVGGTLYIVYLLLTRGSITIPVKLRKLLSRQWFIPLMAIFAILCSTGLIYVSKILTTTGLARLLGPAAYGRMSIVTMYFSLGWTIVFPILLLFVMLRLRSARFHTIQ
jgi:hypothetical protein